MSNKFIREVIELHRFFERWLTGAIEQTQPVFARLKGVLAEDFRMIEPSGKDLNRAELLDAFWHAHGVQAESFTIEVRRPQVLLIDKATAMVTYQEWQTGADTTARISSALISETDQGFQWQHVHETWLASE